MDIRITLVSLHVALAGACAGTSSSGDAGGSSDATTGRPSESESSDTKPLSDTTGSPSSSTSGGAAEADGAETTATAPDVGAPMCVAWEPCAASVADSNWHLDDSCGSWAFEVGLLDLDTIDFREPSCADGVAGNETTVTTLDLTFSQAEATWTIEREDHGWLEAPVTCAQSVAASAPLDACRSLTQLVTDTTEAIECSIVDRTSCSCSFTASTASMGAFTFAEQGQLVLQSDEGPMFVLRHCRAADRLSLAFPDQSSDSWFELVPGA